MNTKIGVIGLGGMGSGIASRLLDLGQRITVWNRTASAGDALVARGAARAATPAEAAASDGVVITMVANDAALESVTCGEHGFLDRLGPEGVHVSMSTVSVGLVRQLAERHAARGSHFIAAPVFGRPEAAAAGKLWVLQSGAPAAKARAKAVLEAIGQGVVDFGEAEEAAPVAKIAGNFMIASSVETMSEAFALLEKCGVDTHIWHDLMTRSLFAGVIHTNYGRFILDRAFSPPGFKLALGAKDVSLALATAQERQVPMPFASVLGDRFLASLAQGRGELDWTAIAIAAANDAGLNR